MISGDPAEGRDEQVDTGGGEEAETENDAPKQSSAPTGFTVLGGFENKPVQKVICLQRHESPVSLVFLLLGS